MGDIKEPDWEERVLGFEDLDPDERKQTEAWLEEHPEAREYLTRLQQKETAAGDELPLIEDAIFEKDTLDADEQRSELEARVELKTRVDSGSVFGSKAGGQRGQVVRLIPWLGALAAVLAIFLMLPMFGDNDDLLSGLQVHGLRMERDVVRSPGSAEVPDGALATGQAFTLDFQLEKDSRVVVVHVDPSGAFSRVVPEAGEAQAPILNGGREHQIPSPESDEDWILGPDVGLETFLVAAHPDLAVDLIPLDEALQPLSGAKLPRLALVERLRGILQDWGAEVESIEFQHVN